MAEKPWDLKGMVSCGTLSIAGELRNTVGFVAGGSIEAVFFTDPP